MKLYARIENEKGKVDGMGANERLNITITIGNEIVAKLNVRETVNGYGLFDEYGIAVKRFKTRTKEKR